MEHEPLNERLHALGEIEIEPGLAADHLDAMGNVRPRRSLARPVAVVASLAVVGAAAIVGVAAAGRQTPNAAGAPPFEVPVSDPPPFDVPVSDPPPVSPPVGPPETSLPEEPSEPKEFECVGQPPFAGTPAESGGRADEALDFAEFRSTQCPASDDAEVVAEPEAAADVEDTDPCHGPPSFAGVPAESGKARAAEALLHASVRSECQDDAPATTEAEEPPSSTPPDVPAGPPANVPAGPPANVPAGPPANVPAGPPANVPAGPPASMPGGGQGR